MIPVKNHIVEVHYTADSRFFRNHPIVELLRVDASRTQKEYEKLMDTELFKDGVTLHTSERKNTTYTMPSDTILDLKGSNPEDLTEDIILLARALHKYILREFGIQVYFNVRLEAIDVTNPRMLENIKQFKKGWDYAKEQAIVKESVKRFQKLRM